jgi:photosystem II stability/assembly factor-like uncharacterized protein
MRRGQLISGFLGTGVIIAATFALGAPPPQPRAKSAENEKEIRETLKQIEALNKRLEELRKRSPASPANASGVNFDPRWADALTWRCIGPAAMGGRIVAFSVFEADPTTYWVGTASGGLLKTTNNGVTFDHQFDHERTVSIGDVCVAPSNRNIVWVGTGEANPRNSVSYGDGVYKSIDGGKTWKHMGLDKTFQIGRVRVHPSNPDIVYVGALGRLYGPNQDRGLYKTTDGGKTWQKVLYIDDRTGVIDVAMHPADPDTLLVATWERQRDEFDSHIGELPPADGHDPYDPVKEWAPGSGLYKTTDGGKTFTKLTKGLPTVSWGRAGIDFYRKDPKTIFLIVESERIGTGPIPQPRRNAGYLGVVGEDARDRARLTRIVAASPAQAAGLLPKDLISQADAKPIASYKQLLDFLGTRKPGDRVAFKVTRDRNVIEIVATLGIRPEAAVSAVSRLNPPRPFAGMINTGQRENVQDKQGPQGFQCGGVYKSVDGGESWTRINSINPRPMYFSQIRVDPNDEKNLYVLGFVLFRSRDGGKSFQPEGSRAVHPDQHALWIDPRDSRHMLVGCDGGFYVTYDRMATWDFLNQQAIGQFYHVAVDRRQPYHVYGGLQDNGTWSGPSHGLRGNGPINEDWQMIGFGDGFVCRVDPQDANLVYLEAQDGTILRRNLHTGESASIRPKPAQEKRPRFDWKMSALLSMCNAPTLPAGIHLENVEVPYRFNWNTPFILSAHNPGILYSAGNHVFRSVKQGTDLRAISPEITRTKRGSGTALAESPLNPDVLYAGTDDGALWVTRDGGGSWTSLAARVGLPGPRWVASIEASRFAEGRAYVVFDAHRSDDDQPYIYITENFGETWSALRGNLPAGSSRVLREDVENADLLYLGTEFGAWASVNRGKTWFKLNGNLPTVAVHEIAVHPAAGEIVAATHGRSLWVLDVAPLRQMTGEALAERAYLFRPNAAVHWRSEPANYSIYGNGSRRFFGQNPPRGAQVYYLLTHKAQEAQLRVVEFTGKTVRDLKVETTPGLHKLTWDLARPAAKKNDGQKGQPEKPKMEPAPPGMYRLVLTVDGEEFVQSIRVEADPAVPNFVLTPPDGPTREREHDEIDDDDAVADLDNIGA